MTEAMVWLAALFAAWVTLGIWLLYMALSDLLWKVALWLDQQAAARQGRNDDGADWWKRRED